MNKVLKERIWLANLLTMLVSILVSFTKLEEIQRLFNPLTGVRYSSVDKSLLTATEHSTTCPWKGKASYYTISVDGKSYTHILQRQLSSYAEDGGPDKRCRRGPKECGVVLSESHHGGGGAYQGPCRFLYVID